MSPEARALSRVEATDTWKGWTNPDALKEPGLDARLYLERRFQAAFLLGIQNGVEIAAERVRNVALGKTD